MAFVIPIVVPVVIAFFLPPLVQHFSQKPQIARNYLILACLFYMISWYIPSPDVEGSFTALSTHFVGGGLFAGTLWIYIKKNLRWNASWVLELASLYFLVSGLGVANELFEFAATRIGFLDISSWDTWWDLLANTSGALLVWFGYMLVKSKA
jgi:hypothetical protein